MDNYVAAWKALKQIAFTTKNIALRKQMELLEHEYKLEFIGDIEKLHKAFTTSPHTKE